MLIANYRPMDRRAFERIHTSIPVRYTFDERLYSGTIQNLSENGMFIKTGNFLPCVNRLEVMVPLDEEISKFNACIRRIEKVDNANYSMGIELLDPPESYLQFVGNLRNAVRS